MPARVAAITALPLRLPSATQAPIAPLVTPLQLQICVSGGISSSVTFCDGVPRSNSRPSRSSGSGESLVEGLHQEGGLADVAHQDAADQPAVAHDQLLVGAALGLGELDGLVALLLGLGDAHGGQLDAHHLQLGGELGAVIGGVEIVPVMCSANTFAWSHSGATRP